MEPIYPYFQVSAIVNNANDLLVFFQHLMNKGIACCISKTGIGYALWREGIEALDSSNSCTQPNKQEMTGEVCIMYDPKNVFKLREEK